MLNQTRGTDGARRSLVETATRSSWWNAGAKTPQLPRGRWSRNATASVVHNGRTKENDFPIPAVLESRLIEATFLS